MRMELRLHIGPHCTATRHLRTVLAANRALLAKAGVRVLDPEYAEQAFAAAIKDLREDRPAEQVKADLMAKLTSGRDLRRIVMIDPNISGSVLRPMGRELFYPRIAITLQRIVNVLGGQSLRIFCGLRNPASFIPAVYSAQQRIAPDTSFSAFLRDTNLPALRWSDFLHRAQLKDNSLGITTWRHEDYPRIWRNIAQALTGIDNRELLVGDSRPVAPGLSLRGALLLHEYMRSHGDDGRAALARVRAVFAQKFPSSQGHVDPALWPEELIAGMTENYEDDWYYIERMENLQVLKPRVYP